MYINEIAPGMPATVRLVRKDKKHFDITTTVVSLGSAQIEKLRKIFGDNFIVTEPMIKLASVDITGCDIHIIGTKNNTSYTWTENVSLKIIKVNKELFHIIICNQNVSNKNLRRSFRQQINVCGTIYLPKNNSNDFVMIRDISLNGIGLSASKDTNVKINDEITLHFKDEEYDVEFTMKLLVVRLKELNENKMIIGCKYLELQDYALSKYITKKQRSGLRKHTRK